MPIPNTLGVEARARVGCRAEQDEDVRAALEHADRRGLPFQVLGEASNVILAERVERFVCVLATRGIEQLDDDGTTVTVRAAAGENWHGLVLHTLREGIYGLENLTLIPGSVGAAPVQNIGAYGVEIAEFVERVEVMDAAGAVSHLHRGSCGFGYRESMFQARQDLTILSVELRLSRQPHVVIDYPDVRAALAARGTNAPTPKDVADVVTEIRRAKLPDPEQDPNVGSFFKNPVVSPATVADLRRILPNLKAFPHGDAFKLSAAQLIDHCGWKSRGTEAVYCWPRQPLVIVNRGRVPAGAVLDFAEHVRADVRARTGVQLELEPSLLS